MLLLAAAAAEDDEAAWPKFISGQSFLKLCLLRSGTLFMCAGAPGLLMTMLCQLVSLGSASGAAVPASWQRPEAAAAAVAGLSMGLQTLKVWVLLLLYCCWYCTFYDRYQLQVARGLNTDSPRALLDMLVIHALQCGHQLVEVCAPAAEAPATCSTCVLAAVA